MFTHQRNAGTIVSIAAAQLFHSQPPVVVAVNRLHVGELRCVPLELPGREHEPHSNRHEAKFEWCLGHRLQAIRCKAFQPGHIFRAVSVEKGQHFFAGAELPLPFSEAPVRFRGGLDQERTAVQHFADALY